MKVLIVNVSDSRGGAAKAAYRLHVGLRKHNIDSKMLVMFKGSNDCNVLEINSSARRLMAKILAFLDTLPVRFYDAKSAFSSSWIPSGSVIKQINEINPDIVHLNWINSGMIRIEDIKKIHAPIVWTLHDMWGFTGGCHYDNDCNAYIDHCNCCKVLKSTKKRDLSFRIWKRKRKTYPKIKDITINCVSKWLMECAEKSSLLKNEKMSCLPNPLDSEKFKPFDSKISRELLGLPLDKKIVLFGALGASHDSRKGLAKFIEASGKIKNDNIEFLMFGCDEPENPPQCKYKINYLGHIHDNVALRLVYCAADVMLVPSIQEAFGQTASEAMSCGTPVVGFAVGGLLDIVDHMDNGYLARPYNTEDLATGIDWVLESNDYENICQRSREKVLREFDNEVVAERYIELYKTILNK